MADVKFACPGCHLHIKVGVEYVGVTSNCPDCNAAFRIPAPPDEVKFACGGCRLKIALHKSYIGTQIECPECRTQILVPDPRVPKKVPAKSATVPEPAKLAGFAPVRSTPPAPAAAKPAPVPSVPPMPASPTAVRSPKFEKPQFVKMEPPSGPRADDVPEVKDRSSVEALAEGPRSRPPNTGAAPTFALPPQAAPPPLSESVMTRPDPEVTCQNCGTVLEEGTEMCTGCGYHLQTGEMPAAEPPVPPPPKKRRQLHIPPKQGKPKPKTSRLGAGAALLFCSLFFFRRLELLFFGRGQPDAQDYIFVAFWGMMVMSALGVLFQKRD